MVQQNNTPSADAPALTAELEDRILAYLPLPVRRWVQEEAPYDCCLRGVFKLVRAGHSPENVLRALRTQARQDTAQVYGRAHPQAAYSTAA